MKSFYDNFVQLDQLLKQQKFTSFREEESFWNSQLNNSEEKSNKTAIILLGYSGNGKSTYAKSICSNDPSFSIVWWDEVVIEYYKKNGKYPSDDMVVKLFSDKLQECCVSNPQNIVIDGFFLSLSTRIVLINTLRGYGYNIEVHDLTGIIEQTLNNRALDEVLRRMPTRGKDVDIDQFIQGIVNEIYNYKKNEDRRSQFVVQKQMNLVDIGADRYISVTNTQPTNNMKM